MEFPGRTAIYRPGLLLTENNTREGDSRFLEKCAQGLFAKFDASSRGSISVSQLARAVVVNALDRLKETKFETFEHPEIVRISQLPVSPF